MSNMTNRLTVAVFTVIVVLGTGCAGDVARDDPEILDLTEGFVCGETGLLNARSEDGGRIYCYGDNPADGLTFDVYGAANICIDAGNGGYVELYGPGGVWVEDGGGNLVEMTYTPEGGVPVVTTLLETTGPVTVHVTPP